MPSSQKIIVVGAGIIGASIAWHLQRKGADVTDIRKELEDRASALSDAGFTPFSPQVEWTNSQLSQLA